MPEVIDIPTIRPVSEPVYRLGYLPDPFAPVPWRVLRRRDGMIDAQHDDQTSGGRFDDSAGMFGVAEARRFRSIYCASERVAAIAESIEPFRSQADSKQRASDLQAIINRHSELRNATGVVPRAWLQMRRVGIAQLDPQLRFVDLSQAEVFDYLQTQLGSLARELGVRRIDYGVLFGSNRRLTQAVASHIYELLDPMTDQPLFAGISYLSTLDLGWRCWAIFDQRSRPSPIDVTALQPQDPDLAQAAARFGLVVEGEQ